MKHDDDDVPLESTPIFKELPDGRFVCWDPVEGTYKVVAREHVPPLVPLRLAQTPPPAAPAAQPPSDDGRPARPRVRL